MNQLRIQSEDAQAKIEELSQKVKTLEQENLAKEQEISSLTYRNTRLEADNEALEAVVKELKGAAESGAQTGTELDALQRKVQLLEEEAEEADKNLRETTEKYGDPLSSDDFKAVMRPMFRKKLALGVEEPELRYKQTFESEEEEKKFLLLSRVVKYVRKG